MNKDNAAQFLPLVQALADGKILQYFSDGEWMDVDCNIGFDDEPEKYRVKPETIKYRLGLFKFDYKDTFTILAAENERASLNFETTDEFVKWISDWEEYEVTSDLEKPTSDIIVKKPLELEDIAIGDKVKVVRKVVQDDTDGMGKDMVWYDSWVEPMSDAIGETFVITDITESGVNLDWAHEEYNFPLKALEKV